MVDPERSARVDLRRFLLLLLQAQEDRPVRAPLCCLVVWLRCGDRFLLYRYVRVSVAGSRLITSTVCRSMSART